MCIPSHTSPRRALPCPPLPPSPTPAGREKPVRCGRIGGHSGLGEAQFLEQGPQGRSGICLGKRLTLAGRPEGNCWSETQAKALGPGGGAVSEGATRNKKKEDFSGKKCKSIFIEQLKASGLGPSLPKGALPWPCTPPGPTSPRAGREQRAAASAPAPGMTPGNAAHRSHREPKGTSRI